MTFPQQTVPKRMNAFRDTCARLGLKITHQRMEIFRQVISTEEHPDVLTIHRRVKKRIPTISLDTAYRTLKLLAEHGLVSVVGMSQESLRFDGNVRPHHHFVCVKCGVIRDFTSDKIVLAASPPEARTFGTPLSLHLEVKGICSTCQRRKKRR